MTRKNNQIHLHNCERTQIRSTCPFDAIDSPHLQNPSTLRIRPRRNLQNSLPIKQQHSAYSSTNPLRKERKNPGHRHQSKDTKKVVLTCVQADAHSRSLEGRLDPSTAIYSHVRHGLLIPIARPTAGERPTDRQSTAHSRRRSRTPLSPNETETEKQQQPPGLSH